MSWHHSVYMCSAVLNCPSFLIYESEDWSHYLLSAGSGRTSTLIAIDILLNEMEEKGGINVFSCVHTLREGRMQMVQTLVCSFFTPSILFFTALIVLVFVSRCLYFPSTETIQIHCMCNPWSNHCWSDWTYMWRVEESADQLWWAATIIIRSLWTDSGSKEVWEIVINPAHSAETVVAFLFIDRWWSLILLEGIQTRIISPLPQLMRILRRTGLMFCQVKT